MRPPPGILVAGAVLATLGSVLAGGFVYDDEPLFLRNPSVTSGRLHEVVTEPLWGVGAPVGYWRPLTSLLLAAGVRCTGGEPWLLHAMSLAIHVVAALTVVGLARDLLGSDRAACLCGLIFGLHPAQVESVAWMSAINDPASGLCVLLTLRAVVRWQRGLSDRLWPAYLWWLLGLLSKETAVIALPLAVLAHFLLRVRPDRGSWRNLLPVAGIAVLVFVARVAVFGDLAAGLVRQDAEHGIDAVSLLLIRFSLFGDYLARLAFRFGTDVMPAARLVAGMPEVAGVVVAVLYLGLCLVARRRLGNVALYGLLAIPVALLPPLAGVGGAGPYALADRYLYVACFGLALALVALLERLASWGSVVGVAIALGLGITSAVNVGNWRDNVTLFEVSLQRNPTSINSHYLLGRALLARHVATGSASDLAKAREHLEQASDLMRHHDQLARTRPVDVEQALAWCRLYEVKSGQARLEDAERLFVALARDHPDRAEGRIGLAAVRWQQGDAASAESELRAVLARDTDHVEARHDLGLLLLRRGDAEAAARELERSLETHPYRSATRRLLAAAYNEVAIELGRRGQADAALAALDRAIALVADAGPYWLQRAKVAVAFQRWSEAERSFRRAVEAMPGSFEACYGLGALLLARNRPAEALPFLERAIELHPQRQRADATAPVGLAELERTVKKLR